MKFLKPIFCCLLAATCAFAAWREGRSEDSSSSFKSAHVADGQGNVSDSGTVSDNALAQESGYADRMSVHIPTDRILRRYYSETLSVIPALMFSPVALQLGFAETVNTPIDEHGNTLLHVASRSGDLFAAWQLLEFGADPHVSNHSFRLPIDLVCLETPQVADALTAAFSSHQNAIAEVMIRRIESGTPVVPQPVSTHRAAETSATAGFTLGVISR